LVLARHFGLTRLPDLKLSGPIENTTSGFSSSSVPNAVGSTWSLPRDAFSYFGARVDVSF
jgi:hypothetical protein